MALRDYERARAFVIADEPFYGLVMGAMLRADTVNRRKLIQAFPAVHDELWQRIDAPGALLRGDPGYDELHDRELEHRQDDREDAEQENAR